MLGDCTITVSHARGNDRGALYEKEPKTSSPARTIPLVARKGRASYLGERSAGHQDPGATSTAYLFEALVAAVKEG